MPATWAGRRVAVAAAVAAAGGAAAAAARATGSWRAGAAARPSARAPCAGAPPRLTSELPLWGSRGKVRPNLRDKGMV